MQVQSELSQLSKGRCFLNLGNPGKTEWPRLFPGIGLMWVRQRDIPVCIYRKRNDYLFANFESSAYQTEWESDNPDWARLWSNEEGAAVETQNTQI